MLFCCLTKNSYGAISALAACQVRQNWNFVWPLMGKGANLLVVICLALTIAASERNIRDGVIDLGNIGKL
jgi:hypothetical protein